MTPPALMTAEELLHANIPDKRTELNRGVPVIREPARERHGRVTMNLTVPLALHVRRERLGQMYAAETGFILARNPDTVRAPDIAFVRSDRVPDPDAGGYLEGAPDLAVEVLGRDDHAGEVLSKVGDWLAAGARLVWVINPQRRLARVYRQDGSEAVVSETETLDGEDVIPGFLCPLHDIL